MISSDDTRDLALFNPPPPASFDSQARFDSRFDLGTWIRFSRRRESGLGILSAGIEPKEIPAAENAINKSPRFIAPRALRSCFFPRQ